MCPHGAHHVYLLASYVNGHHIVMSGCMPQKWIAYRYIFLLQDAAFLFGIACGPHRCSLNALHTFKIMGEMAFLQQRLLWCECSLKHNIKRHDKGLNLAPASLPCLEERPLDHIAASKLGIKADCYLFDECTPVWIGYEQIP